MIYTLTVIRTRPPEGEVGEHWWSVDYWHAGMSADERSTLAEGRALTERLAYIAGLQSAYKLGLCVAAGDARHGYELTPRAACEPVERSRGNEAALGLLPG